MLEKKSPLTMELGITDETRVVFTARKNVVKMLEHRGYTVRTNPWDTTIDEFAKVSNSKPEMGVLTIRAKRNGVLLLVFFPEESKLNVPALREMTDFAKEKFSNTFIIVFKDKITTFARNFIQSYKAEEHVNVESFHISTLQYCILEHALVPPHRILQKNEEEAVLKKYRAEKADFPTILMVDAVAKYLGVRLGNMIEIQREHPSGFMYNVYRVARRAITR